nr:retrovirus-related Pol polyprotein from transposon TNT 1-94 [Tanacetum cinerariifolium]GFA13224.1 retrovirus-related Pol polyprotein from transposon TNT 1-94 [Tanacetum cinerariifolium]
NRGQGINPRGGSAAGYGGVQNRVGNANPGQATQVKCNNCNGTGHIAKNCTQPKHPQNSKYYKDKMLLMQAQEHGVALDAEQLLFLVDSVTDEAGPSYDSDILSEVQDHNHYQDAVYAHHEEHAMHDNVQLSHIVDSHADYTSNSNMIPYDQYVKDNAVPVVHRVHRCTNASGSQPRRNTKNHRISPAKGVNKMQVKEQPRKNKYHLRTSNRVDSSSHPKHTVINSNSDSVCQT